MKYPSLLITLIFIVSHVLGQQQVDKPHLDPANTLVIENNNPVDRVSPYQGNLNLNWSFEISTPKSGFIHDVPDPVKLRKVKTEKTLLKQNNHIVRVRDYRKSTTDPPLVFSSFDANVSIHNSPTDNTFAISNEGIIVSAINSKIEYYSPENKRTYSKSFYDFFADQTLTGILYDPNLLFDPLYNRFIFVVLHGNSSSDSKLLLAFSKTSDPADGWNLYQMPFKDINPSVYANKWIDFPRIGISTNELFVSVNIFYDNEGGFYKPLLFQVNKNDGYEGKAVRRKIWDNIRTQNNKVPFTLVPVSYGHNGNIGPGIYLVSNENDGSNKIHLFEITNEMQNGPQVIAKTLSTESYEISGDALQKGSKTGYDPGVLNTGDCRIQTAFYYSDNIHFVFNGDAGSGYSGIFYYRLNVRNDNLERLVIPKTGYDLAFPSVVSSSPENSHEQDVLISYLISNKDGYPGFGVFRVDEQMNYSDLVTIADGDDYVDILGDVERWGDYTTLQRKYNTSAPIIWASGCKATNYRNFSTVPATIVSNTWVSVLAELADNKTNSTEGQVASTGQTAIFPNPVYNGRFTYKFQVPEKGRYAVEIVNLNGKTVKTLFSDVISAGTVRLAFNRLVLPDGNYILIVKNQNQILQHESFVVVH